MEELSTPTRVKTGKKVTDRAELNTPVKIPASPFLQQIGYGTGAYLGKFCSYFFYQKCHLNSKSRDKLINNNKNKNVNHHLYHYSIFTFKSAYKFIYRFLSFSSGIAVYMMQRSPKVGCFARSPWAIKKWVKGKSSDVNNSHLRLEANILRQLNHPNIVGFRAFATGPDGKPCLAMEAVDMSLGTNMNV